MLCGCVRCCDDSFRSMHQNETESAASASLNVKHASFDVKHALKGVICGSVKHQRACCRAKVYKSFAKRVDDEPILVVPSTRRDRPLHTNLRVTSQTESLTAFLILPRFPFS